MSRYWLRGFLIGCLVLIGLFVNAQNRETKAFLQSGRIPIASCTGSKYSQVEVYQHNDIEARNANKDRIQLKDTLHLKPNKKFISFKFLQYKYNPEKPKTENGKKAREDNKWNDNPEDKGYFITVENGNSKNIHEAYNVYIELEGNKLEGVIKFTIATSYFGCNTTGNLERKNVRLEIPYVIEGGEKPLQGNEIESTKNTIEIEDIELLKKGQDLILKLIVGSEVQFSEIKLEKLSLGNKVLDDPKVEKDTENKSLKITWSAIESLFKSIKDSKSVTLKLKLSDGGEKSVEKEISFKYIPIESPPPGRRKDPFADVAIDFPPQLRLDENLNFEIKGLTDKLKKIEILLNGRPIEFSQLNGDTISISINTVKMFLVNEDYFKVTVKMKSSKSKQDKVLGKTIKLVSIQSLLNNLKIDETLFLEKGNDLTLLIQNFEDLKRYLNSVIVKVDIEEKKNQEYDIGSNYALTIPWKDIEEISSSRMQGNVKIEINDAEVEIPFSVKVSGGGGSWGWLWWLLAILILAFICYLLYKQRIALGITDERLATLFPYFFKPKQQFKEKVREQPKSNVLRATKPPKSKITIRPRNLKSMSIVTPSASSFVGLDLDDYYAFDLTKHWEETTISTLYLKHDCIGVLAEKILLETIRGTEHPPELAGFFMGQWIQDESTKKYKVTMEEFIHFEPSSHDVYEVTFDAVAWNALETAKAKFDKLEVVSWFHTHPGHGLFLSNPDLNIQTGHFREPYQFAFEIDTFPEDGIPDVGFFTWKKDPKSVLENADTENIRKSLAPFMNKSNSSTQRWFKWDKIKQWYLKKKRKDLHS